MKEVIDLLIKCNKKISTMESCTGGAVASAITDIENASLVLEFSAVTYSNEYKVKMGADNDIIDKYTVYSMEVAKDMSKKISVFANSNYGVGITGKLNRVDINNPYGSDNKVFISIYDRDNDMYYDKEVEVFKRSRSENKKVIIDEIIGMLINIIN